MFVHMVGHCPPGTGEHEGKISYLPCPRDEVYTLEQGGPTAGPRAKFGPRVDFFWPASTHVNILW